MCTILTKAQLLLRTSVLGSLLSKSYPNKRMMFQMSYIRLLCKLVVFEMYDENILGVQYVKGSEQNTRTTRQVYYEEHGMVINLYIQVGIL